MNLHDPSLQLRNPSGVLLGPPRWTNLVRANPDLTVTGYWTPKHPMLAPLTPQALGLLYASDASHRE